MGFSVVSEGGVQGPGKTSSGVVIGQDSQGVPGPCSKAAHPSVCLVPLSSNERQGEVKKIVLTYIRKLVCAFNLEGGNVGKYHLASRVLVLLFYMALYLQESSFFLNIRKKIKI